MCELCERAKESAEYKRLIERMTEEDINRMEFTKQMSAEMKFLEKKCYSSVKWPVKLFYPMFDARMAYAVPSNYFQPLMVDGERAGNNFSHGSMRSVFFLKDRLMLLSKNTNHTAGKQFFTSYILLHLDKKDYKLKIDGDSFNISADVEKPMKNLVTGKTENKKIRFNFVHTAVKGRIVTREKVLTSAKFKNIYGKYAGGTRLRTASIDLEGYAITVPHLAPHPFMLQLKEQFGYESNRQFQEHVIDYFRANV